MGGGFEYWSVKNGPRYIVNQTRIYILRFFPFHFLHKSESKAGTIPGGQGKKRVRAIERSTGFLLISGALMDELVWKITEGTKHIWKIR